MTDDENRTGRATTAQGLLEIAAKWEDGRYLFGHFDKEQEALCQAAVDEGYAEWLPVSSRYRPGVRLTRRGFLQAQGQP